eukprot:GFKZ01010281.1.p1 GENE.GFKZ01010281.1~~GFKZ01010281.1.p1  ORF type:complete len:1889 (+),score=337.09 GFKZ01010281.1:227-5893(+)
MSSDNDDDFDKNDDLEEPEMKFDDSSEEDEDQDQFEEDDFVVGDDDDEDDAEAMPRRAPPPPAVDEEDHDEIAEKKKKKKKKRKYHYDDDELADGDIQLLEEGGVRVEKKKLKRLRRGTSDDEDNGDLDGLRELDEDEEEEDRYEDRRRGADDPVDYDEDDDFIDDGGRQKRRRAAEREGLVSSEAVRQARSIFGDVEDMTGYRGVDKLFHGKDGQGADDDRDEDFNPDAEPEELPLRTIRERDTDRLDDEDEMMPPQQLSSQHGTIAEQLSAPEDDTEAKRVVSTDIPEQLQYHFGLNHREPSEAELREEGAWIYAHGFAGNPLFRDFARFDPEEVTTKIVVVLSYIHIDKLDIPFIAMYRKDYITPFLIPPAGERLRRAPTTQEHDEAHRIAMPHPRGFNSMLYNGFTPNFSFDHLRGVPRGYDDGFGDWSILWHILDLDKRYSDMLKKRQEILDAAKEAAEKGVPPAVVTDVEDVVKSCEVEQSLKDAEAYLQMAVDLAEVLSSDGNPMSQFMGDNLNEREKRPSRRKNRYAEFCKRGYRSLAAEFGLSARQYGENVKGSVELAMQSHMAIDPDDEPIEVALVYAERFGESAERAGIPPEKLADRLLSAARFILVTEIAVDMAIVQTARSVLCKPGTVAVSTTPTRSGISQVGDAHPMRLVTNIFERKLETFRCNIDFALAMRAVEMGFTKLEVVFQPEQLITLEKALKDSFITSGVSSAMVEMWNEQRMQIVQEVNANLVRKMKAEVIERLTDQTNDIMRYELSQAASRRLLLGPGRPSLNPLDNGCPRVLSVCVTLEDDEERDPLQAAKDFEEAKTKGQMVADRRIAHERLTFVELDENGEYQTGYELFAQWLRRPTRRDLPQSQLPGPIKEQLMAFIAQSRAQFITIGIGSGGRAVMRLQTDIMDVITEMIYKPPENEEERPRRPLMLSQGTMDKIKQLAKREEDQRQDGNEREADATLQEIRGTLMKYVVLADDFPARIYARTDAALIGLSVDAMTLLEKRAIGLGRMAQEPLWVYCAIGQEEDEAVSLKFHPFHFIAKPKDRFVALRRALFRSVCANGVDINRMLRLPHTQSMLAFVGGLGVHKGKGLLRALESSMHEEERGLLSRKHLWSENYLGRIVFLSTAAFLRVRDPELHAGGSTRRAVEVRRAKLGRRGKGRRRDDGGPGIFDPLDDSRIHPEHYAVAIKIADEALRDDEGQLHIDLSDTEEFHESLRMTAAVLDDPSGLNRLALDEYAGHLELLGRGSLFETVKTIASEFAGPYKDHRIALQSPEPAAVFYIVTGADPLHMRPGSMVTATDCRIRERKKKVPDRDNIFGITCFLPNNVRGYIPISRFADDLPEEDKIRQLVPDGSTISCRVLEIEYLRFEAVLTSRMSAISNPSEIPRFVPLVDTSDPAYRPYPRLDPQEINATHLLASQDASGPAKRSNAILGRTMASLRSNAKPVVTHPLFREIAGNDAITELRLMLPGDIIIRPSQYDKDGIIFSCKFANFNAIDSDNNTKGVFHKDCQMEYDPQNEDVPLRLKVDGNVYEYIDQVLEQYLRPIISNLAECLDHRKFISGTEKELEAHVTGQKRANRGMIPYVFGLSERNPTSLVLVYIPGTSTVEKEEIKVAPDGYRLRSVLHKNMNVLFTWFKKNMRNRPSTRKPATRENARASPFNSAYSAAASPFHRPASSAYQGARSPFTAPKSPFSAPKSPFTAPRSPFAGGARATPRPVDDVPPPPAPLPTASIPDPYARPSKAPASSRMPYSSNNESNPIGAEEWAKATLSKDDPPPRSEIENGSYKGGQASRGPSQRPPPSPRRGWNDDSRRNGRGPPPRGPYRGRSTPPRSPHRGPPNRGPPPRGGPHGGQARGDEEDGMPRWRGKKPMPAWMTDEASQQ